MCTGCSGWVHSKCSGLQNAAEYRRIKNWACISCSSPPTPQILKPLPSPITTKASDGDPFTILQFNANGIGNKQVELGDFLERHEVKVVVIQESKLTINSRTPNIQNFTTVRKDRDQGQGGGLLRLIHKSINLSRRPDSPDTLAEELTITAKLGNTDLIITTPNAENEAITFDGSQVTSSNQIANYFNRQFTTSKLGRHTSSRDTRLVSREIKRKYLTSAVTFTTDQVTKGISSCSNTRAFGPDKGSIFHLKHLGSRGIEYLTALFNDSVTSCRIPLIWKSSQSRKQARTALSALLSGLYRSSVRQ